MPCGNTMNKAMTPYRLACPQPRCGDSKRFFRHAPLNSQCSNNSACTFCMHVRSSWEAEADKLQTQLPLHPQPAFCWLLTCPECHQLLARPLSGPTTKSRKTWRTAPRAMTSATLTPIYCTQPPPTGDAWFGFSHCDCFTPPPARLRPQQTRAGACGAESRSQRYTQASWRCKSAATYTNATRLEPEAATTCTSHVLTDTYVLFLLFE